MSHDRPPSSEHTKVVSCITRGSEVCGFTYSAAKRHARQGQDDYLIPQSARSKEELEIEAMKITFDQDDLSDQHQKHHDGLIIQITIGNCLTKRVLIDGGSSANVIFLGTLKATTLVGFNGDTTNTLGKIILFGYAKGVNKQTRFNVIDCKSAYNAILGRPWIHEMKAVPSTYQQTM